MRLQITISELTEDQWDLLQRQLKTGYDFPAGASRVCVTFEYGELERHAEMPLSTHIGLLAALGMTGAVRATNEALASVREAAGLLAAQVRDENDKNARPEGADQ